MLQLLGTSSSIDRLLELCPWTPLGITTVPHGATTAKKLGDDNRRSGVQDRSPGRGFGDKVPQKLTYLSICRLNSHHTLIPWNSTLSNKINLFKKHFDP